MIVEVVVAGVGPELREVAGADVLEVLADRDGVGLADALVGASEDEHAREGDDERRDADDGDPETLPRTGERADAEAEQDAEPPGDAPVAHGNGDADAREGGNRPDGQVDVARDDHEDHPDRHDEDVAVALEDVDDVAGVEGQPARLPLEEHDEGDQGKDHPELAGVASEDLLELVHAASFGVDSEVELEEPVLVMRRMRDSWSAAPLSRTPVIRPSLIV